MSEEYSIYHNYDNWKNSIKEYEHNKKNLEWGHNPRPQIMTHKIVKSRENIFNPISQKYYDESYNKALKQNEKEKLVDTVAKNYDRVLRNEQTFNLINLKDKLKGFETHPDYPEFKNDCRKIKLETSKANYNIISNINLDKHHYLPPEQRPQIIDEKIDSNIKSGKFGKVVPRDYDVITNKYRNFHEEKVKADFEISRLNAAKNYWKTHDYDHIKGRYIDERKEQEYLSKKKQDEIAHANKKPNDGHKEPVYNSVSHIVLDDQKLKENDDREKNKKKRFEIRYDIEDFYRNKNFEKEIIKEKKLDGKLSYNRFKTTDTRGYDILNFGNNFEHYKNNVKVKDDRDEWEHIIEKAGPKETINSKGVYRDPYDFTENEKTSHLFKLNREKMIQNLPKITEDPLYNIESIEKSKKSNDQKISAVSQRISHSSHQLSNADKKAWFSESKDNNSLNKHSGNIVKLTNDPKLRMMANPIIKKKKGIF